MKKFNILICGHARHGKDTTAELISKYFGLTFKSSSMAAAEIFIYDKLKALYGYKSFEACFEDRVNHRSEWYDLICEYNKEDKAKLAKEILNLSDMYVGMRDNDEIQECLKQGVFDLIIGVYNPRKPEEPKDSFNIDLFKVSDIIIYNNQGLKELEEKVKRLPLPSRIIQNQCAPPWWATPTKKMWLDIDGVIADFEQHFLKYLNLPLYAPTDWDDYRFREEFHKVCTDDNFWLTCPPLVRPEEIIYPVAGYCTARPCSTELVVKWLKENRFPQAPVINVGSDGDKVKELKKVGCDVMLDDGFHNFVELNTGGINCYLKTRPHNVKYDVGYKRANTIQEFIEKIR